MLLKYVAIPLQPKLSNSSLLQLFMRIYLSPYVTKTYNIEAFTWLLHPEIKQLEF